MHKRVAHRAGVFVALIGAVVLLGAIASSSPAADRRARGNGGDEPAGLQAYRSPYYEIYSDLEPERVQEAILRMTRMAEEYHDRTRDFSGQINQKFPFYLFKNAEDYYGAGGLAGSDGVFMVRGGEAKLMAVAGAKSTANTWRVIQHEGFHQFAHAVIGGNLPAWVNEGLAEYFGEGIFTGDGMVTGVMPPGRLKAVQEGIKNRKFPTVRYLMELSLQGWNQNLRAENYDMAWSMVYFLAHGEDGRYQGAFTQFIRDVGRGRPWARAWLDNFGTAEGFEQKWAAWWLAREPLASKDLYVKAVVSTCASYVGRAGVQKQTFDSMDEFVRAAREQSIKLPPNDWLPPTLVTSMLKVKDYLGDDVKYELKKDPRGPQVIATLPDGTRVVAMFVRQGVKKVVTSVDDLAPMMARAKALVAEKRRPEARALLQGAIKRNLGSPQVTEARKLLGTMM